MSQDRTDYDNQEAERLRGVLEEVNADLATIIRDTKREQKRADEERAFLVLSGRLLQVLGWTLILGAIGSLLWTLYPRTEGDAGRGGAALGPKSAGAGRLDPGERDDVPFQPLRESAAAAPGDRVHPGSPDGPPEMPVLSETPPDYDPAEEEASSVVVEPGYIAPTVTDVMSEDHEEGLDTEDNSGQDVGAFDVKPEGLQPSWTSIQGELDNAASEQSLGGVVSQWVDAIDDIPACTSDGQYSSACLNAMFAREGLFEVFLLHELGMCSGEDVDAIEDVCLAFQNINYSTSDRVLAKTFPPGDTEGAAIKWDKAARDAFFNDICYAVLSCARCATVSSRMDNAGAALVCIENDPPGSYDPVLPEETCRVRLSTLQQELKIRRKKVIVSVTKWNPGDLVRLLTSRSPSRNADWGAVVKQMIDEKPNGSLPNNHESRLAAARLGTLFFRLIIEGESEE